MSVQSAEVAADFRDALQDLRINSRPEISNLTLIAKENTEFAQAISTELENHIRTTRPEWKLPALYVLDSIVKNVGTPYTVYLGRNLYRTFMDAYLVMDPGTRKAMEGLLKTWKQPVPESMDPRPVFPADVTKDIENALIKIRTVTVQQQAHRPLQHALPPRPPSNVAWRSTPTPPQNGPRYAAPNDPRVRQPSQTAPQFAQYSASAAPQNNFQQPQPTAQPLSSIDLADLKAEVAKLITNAQATFAYNPADIALRTKLQALLQLKQVLDTQTLPPQQLEAVRKQIQSLAPTPPPAPALAPAPTFTPQAAPPAAVPSPQQTVPPTFPPASATPNIAQLLANFRPPVPSAPPVQHAATPTNAPTPSLADLLKRVSSPGESSSTPTLAPPYLPPPPVVPASAPSATPTPTNNLAQLLAQFSKPAAPLPAQQPTPVPPLPVQLPGVLPMAAPTLGSAEWLLNALKGMPQTGTPTNSTPIGSEPMTRQSSAPVIGGNDLELTTASMKKPRLHLISKLYEAYPNLCATCGRRFENTAQGKEKKARHMDWHFKVKDPDASKRGVHRSWYIGEKEWIEYREVDETSPEQVPNGVVVAPVKKQPKDKYVSVPQDAALSHSPCPICQEKFETQWNVEANDFVWMDALKVGGKIYHATCWDEYSKGAGIQTPGTPEAAVLGKRKAEVSTPNSGKKVRAY